MGEGWEKERMDGWMDGLMDRRRNEGRMKQREIINQRTNKEELVAASKINS